MSERSSTPGTTPRAARPVMPGYGVAPADEGAGLLPWSWAEDRLIRSHDYWLATVWPDGRPHVMPVWAVWFAVGTVRRASGDEERSGVPDARSRRGGAGEVSGTLWFSSSVPSRKARNLRADPRCVMTTDDALEPVVVDGTADVVTDVGDIATFLAASNAKYQTDFGIDFLDPAVNATFRVASDTVFSLSEDDFTGTPTRWHFDP